jgi:hypothetical protein
MRNLGYQPLAALAAPVATCHVGLSPGLVDEHQARRVNLALVALPLRPPPGHVRSILLAGVLAFFEADALVREEVPDREAAHLDAAAGQLPATVRNVMSGVAASRASSQSRSPAF